MDDELSWLDALSAVADAATPDARTDALFARPELFAPEVAAALRESIRAKPDADRTRLGSVLDSIAAIGEAIRSKEASYILENGPIEKLWTAVALKQISLPEAERLARTQALGAVLAPIYVSAIGSAAGKIAIDASPADALVLLRVLLAALEARAGGPLRDEAGRNTCLTFCDCAAAALREEPDGRLFRRADRLTTAVVDWARESHNRDEHSKALWRLAELYSFPWISGRRFDNNLENVLWRWERRFYEEHADELAGVSPEEWQMPAAVEIVTRARILFDEVAALMEGHRRALALKSWVDAGGFLKALGVEIDTDELVGRARIALSLFEPGRDLHEQLGLVNMVSVLGGDVDPADIDHILDGSVDELVRRHGHDEVWDLLRQACQALITAAPARASQTLRDLRVLQKISGTESRLETLWSLDLELISAGYAPKTGPVDSMESFERAIEELRSRHQRESWDVARFAAGLLRLARLASSVDAESRALELLTEVRRLAPVFVAEHADSIKYLEAELHIGLGSNAFLGGDVSGSIEPYSTALEMFIEIGLPGRALDVIPRLRDCVSDGTPTDALLAAGSVASFNLELQVVLGEPAVRLTTDLCKRAIARNSTGKVNPDAVIFLLQAVKGPRFGAQYFAGARYQAAQDETAMRLLRDIDEIESEAGSGPTQTEVDETFLLAAYTRPDVPRSGSSSADRLANLRHAFDAHMNAKLLGPEPEFVVLPLEAIQAALDNRTVLLILYLGATADGNLAVITTAMTAETIRIMTVAVPEPDYMAQVEVGGGLMQMSPFGFLVQDLREELSLPPEPFDATRGALEALHSGREVWFGNLLDALPDWRAAGKDHLCIVPHGPLHTYPFHLIPDGDEPLASDWKVTYLPNMFLLLADRRSRLRRWQAREMAAFGLSYEKSNPYGLSWLPEARVEAVSIAREFGIDPVLDDDVTEVSVVDGLLKSKMIHIAAHGRHDVEAPAFQCLYLTPTDQSDGRLSAHELLAYDLRGTELVTLSACETALGRFDLADNLTGLPASLLLAGVETIVGTLWPVETETAEYFFLQLYRAIRRGTDRLDAFATAQRSTRRRFPQYRDWGCFYYIGEWR